MGGLQWSGQITVGDVLTFVGLLGGVFSLVFLVVQVRAGARQVKTGIQQATISAEQATISAEQAQLAATAQRGRFLLDVINRYFDDKEILRLYQLIDSDSFKFNPATYVGSPDAAAVARTLYYFDTLKFLVDRNLILLEDVAILRYRIDAFFKNPHIQSAVSRNMHTRHGSSSHILARDLYDQLQALPSSLEGID